MLFDDIVSTLGLGARLNHFSYYTSAGQLNSYDLQNQRHVALYAVVTLTLISANTWALAHADLLNFTWIIRHNNRLLLRNRGGGPAGGGFMGVATECQVHVAFEGATANCVVAVNAKVPIYEVLDGGKLDVGLSGNVVQNWGRQIDVVTLDVTGLAKVFPKSRTG